MSNAALSPRGLAVGALLLAGVGCAGRSEHGGGQVAGSSDAGEEWIVAPNIDIVGCDDFLTDRTPEHSETCRTCCVDAGYRSATYIHEGRCSCGRPRDERVLNICSTSKADECGACCKANGFSPAVFLGRTCGCSEMDLETCSSVPVDSGAKMSCARCCVETGYITTYTPLGTCGCANP